MSPRPPILVLDGHTTQALACVRSLGRARFPTFVASERLLPLAAWSRYSRGGFHLAAESLPAYAALRTWAQSRGVQVVLPVTERSCLLCNAERDEWIGAGMVVACGPDSMLRQAFDKARTLQRAAACGVAIPPTRYPTSLAECVAAARDLGPPCVVKPRFSNAWHGGGFLPDPGIAYAQHVEDIERAALARRQGTWWPLIQGFVEGRGKGVFALCDHGRVLQWFAHERLRDVRPTGSGSSLRRSVPLDPRLRGPAERLLADLAWHGPAMLEFRDDGRHDPWLIEVNGRFWGSLQLAVAAGVDFPLWWIQLLLGETPGPAAGYRVGVTVRWLWGDVKRLLHVMTGPPPGYPRPYPTAWQGVREFFGRQPPGTRFEAWDRADPLPAVAELVQGLGELVPKVGRNGTPRREMASAAA
jgi:predicted ATP-grasp superfamily ATP-dependent carboligase